METADSDYAAKVARFLLGSYPNQAHEPEVFLTQLAILFTGKSRSLLQAMTHPETGLVSECQFLTVAAAKAWLDKSAPIPPRREFPLLPPAPKEPPIPPKERARRVAMLKGVAQQIRETVKAKCVGRPQQTKQINNHAKRMEALKTFTDLGA